MADRLEQTFEECLELLSQGVSLEECLARYPEYARELEPLLRSPAGLAAALRGAGGKGTWQIS